MQYKSNVDTVLLILQRKLTKVSDISELQRTVGTFVKASNLERIDKGFAVDFTPIGVYNTTRPLYVNPNKSPLKFATKGKTGKAKFKNGSPHKTGYFLSYREFRARIGRNVAVVNQQLTGRLFRSWQIEQNGKDWAIGFNSKYGALVSRGNERRFAKQIWGVTKKDLEQIKIIEQEFIRKALATT